MENKEEEIISVLAIFVNPAILIINLMVFGVKGFRITYEDNKNILKRL